MSCVAYSAPWAAAKRARSQNTTGYAQAAGGGSVGRGGGRKSVPIWHKAKLAHAALYLQVPHQLIHIRYARIWYCPLTRPSLRFSTITSLINLTCRILRWRQPLLVLFQMFFQRGVNRIWRCASRPILVMHDQKQLKLWITYRNVVARALLFPIKQQLKLRLRIVVDIHHKPGKISFPEIRSAQSFLKTLKNSFWISSIWMDIFREFNRIRGPFTDRH